MATPGTQFLVFQASSRLLCPAKGWQSESRSRSGLCPSRTPICFARINHDAFAPRSPAPIITYKISYMHFYKTNPILTGCKLSQDDTPGKLLLLNGSSVPAAGISANCFESRGLAGGFWRGRISAEEDAGIRCRRRSDARPDRGGAVLRSARSRVGPRRELQAL